LPAGSPVRAGRRCWKTSGSSTQIGPDADTIGGATGEDKARAFDVYGYAFLARRPWAALRLGALRAPGS
jgi:hypothetical protein